MAATMTPRLREQMLAALHGVEGRWGPSADPLPVTLRLESPEDLQAVAEALQAWGAEGISSAGKGPNLSCRLPPARLWDLLGLEGVLDVSEGVKEGERVGRGRLWAALGAGVVAAGLFIVWLAGQGPSGMKTEEKGSAGPTAAATQKDLPREEVVKTALSGDSFRLASGHLVRLAGLVAPAYGDPAKSDEVYGAESKEALAVLAEGKAIRLTYSPHPHAGRGYLLAYVTLADGKDLGASLLEKGAAQFDMESAGPDRRASYSRLEAEAREAKRGLWGGPIVGNMTSKVYHLPGGQFYNRVSSANRVLFATEEEARSAGYRPSAH